MYQFIAFIRGINGGLTLKMVDLRQLFEGLGYANVRTVLATGNVIFETSQNDRRTIAELIEQAVAQTYQYETAVVIYTLDELERLIVADPFRDVTVTMQTRPQVTFTKEPLGQLPLSLPHKVPQKGYEVIGVVDGAICSVIDLSGATRPNLLAALDQALNKKATTRNWQTIERCYHAMKSE